MGTAAKIYLFGSLDIERLESGTWSHVSNWTQARTTRSVLRRLLVAPGRKLSRGQIQEDLWPDLDQDLADKYLNNAASQIRAAIGRELLHQIESGYGMPGQQVLWTDLDACHVLLRQVENIGPRESASLPLLEEALGYLERGQALEGEDGTWSYGLRRRVEDLLRQVRVWLAEHYEAYGKLWQAAEQYRTLLGTLPPDEGALRAWMTMLHKHGRTAEALKCYQDAQDSFSAQGIMLSPAIAQFAATLSVQPQSAAPSPVHMVPGILLFRRPAESGGQAERAALSPHLFLDTGLLDRLERVLDVPARITYADVQMLAGMVLEQKQQLVKGSDPNWHEMLTAASHTLRVCVSLLESRAGHADQLTHLAGEICLLIGDVLFNTGNVGTAPRYYAHAYRAAQEIQDGALQAIVLGRHSLLLIDRQQARQATLFLEEAIRLAEGHASSSMHSWLAVVRAEAYATLGQETVCREALEDSRELLVRNVERAASYTFVPDLVSSVYGAAKLLGYEGSCYLHLQQPDQAQRVLAESRASSSHPHHQSLVSVDFARVRILQYAPQEACAFIEEALAAIAHTHSPRAFSRVVAVAQKLDDAWHSLPEVRDLAEQIHEVRRSL